MQTTVQGDERFLSSDIFDVTKEPARRAVTVAPGQSQRETFRSITAAAALD